MKERPILFSAPMVRAILAGTKTQTRRIYKPRECEPYEIVGEDDEGKPWPMWTDPMQGRDYHAVRCPYGAAGERLWVKEGLRWGAPHLDGSDGVEYAADGTFVNATEWTWKRKALPGMFMPRWASRITLEVTGVRVERLEDISEEDARAEGITVADLVRAKVPTARDEFRYLWDTINGERAAWATNPWVWAVAFRRVLP